MVVNMVAKIVIVQIWGDHGTMPTGKVIVDPDPTATHGAIHAGVAYRLRAKNRKRHSI